MREQLLQRRVKSETTYHLQQVVVAIRTSGVVRLVRDTGDGCDQLGELRRITVRKEFRLL